MSTSAQSEGKLKHYKEYIERLTLFASAIGVKIEYVESASSDGIWFPAARKIKIDDDLTEQEEIATLLHELGHSMDDILSAEWHKEKRLGRAYTAMYSKKPTKKQVKLVVECEQRAWNYGRDIARRLNIRLGKWYSVSEQDGLKSYRDN